MPVGAGTDTEPRQTCVCFHITVHLHLIKDDDCNHIHAAATCCTHCVVVICLELSQFQAATKGLNISEFPSE